MALFPGVNDAAFTRRRSNAASDQALRRPSARRVPSVASRPITPQYGRPRSVASPQRIQFGYEAPARLGGGITSPVYLQPGGGGLAPSLERIYQADPAFNPIAVTPGAGDGTGGVPDAQSELDRLRRERLAAALEAIGADFDMQEGGLQRQLEALKNLFDRSMLDTDRNEMFAREAIDDNAVERGLFRSGIRAKNIVRGLTPFQERRSDIIGQLNPVEGAEGTQVRDIMSLIKLLVPQEARAKAGAELGSESEQLDIEKLLALLNAGLGGLG